MKHRPKLPRPDIDQLLIFFLLAVTIDQAGVWLGTFAPAGRAWLGYLHAAAVDLAIWRSGWWYRKYKGRKQRRWSLVGVVGFSLVSAGYNFGYYSSVRPALPIWQAALMAVVLPVAVALLSYLYGQKDESQATRTKDTADAAEPEREPAVDAPIATPVPWTCDRCQRTFPTQQALAGHRRTCRPTNGAPHEPLAALEVIHANDH